jgi:uncharacterized protein (TIGR02246 family)
VKNRAGLLVVLGLLFAWTGTAAAQAPQPVNDLIAKWQSAFNAGDYAGAAAQYTDDAMRAPPGQALIRGREGIQASMSQFAGVKIKLSAAGALMGDAVGTSWGDYELSGTMDGKPFSQKGRWMNAMKKTADGWKIYRDIWNEKEPGAM